MKTHRAGRAEQQQRRGEYLQQAKAMEIQKWSPSPLILDQARSITRIARTAKIAKID
jgi:hypothetical protein